LTPSQPPITRTTHTLPFDKLSPRDFERLCLWLVEREGYERAEHLGAVAMQIQGVPVGSGAFGNSSPPRCGCPSHEVLWRKPRRSTPTIP